MKAQFVVALAAFSISTASIMTTAKASTLQCQIGPTSQFANPNQLNDLVINPRTKPIKAILISQYFSEVYDCVEAITDAYECYGFHQKPFEAPSQLNISSTEVGSLVISSTLNLGFVSSYSDSGFQAGDRTSRRIAIDTYTIKSCK